jgi:hypothetical protein
MSLRVNIQNINTNCFSDIFFVDEDLKHYSVHWESNDQLLVELGDISNWKFDKWSQLTPGHYQVLLLQAINKWLKLDEDDKVNEAHPATFTLYLILVFFSLSLEQATSSKIFEIQIYLFDENVYYTWRATSAMLNFKPDMTNNVIKLVRG